MEFASPFFLFGLIIIPILIVWYIFRCNNQQAYVRFSDTGFFDKLPRSWKAYLRHIVFVLEIAALSLFIIALARPQSSSKNQTVNIEGIDIVLAMDISSSMLAADLKPDRLEAAKLVASDFVKGRPGDRMGLVIFSGETFTQVPLTTDHGMMLNMLKDMKCGMLEDGTAIGDGLASAISRLKDSEAISKVVILLTDGDNNAGSIDPSTAAEMAKIFGIRVYTIGAGTRGTAPYPVQTPFGGIKYQQVPVTINEDILKHIANETGGKYFRAESEQKLQQIYDEIDKMERSKIEVNEFRRLHEEFYPFVIWGLILLITSFILKNTIFKSITE
ncbi:MAG: VWA domain-containing protein [Lentimicrobiaceae bacterium]|nr:VWA domain-containing protein [Lentimicrobiaceae bacterium]